MKLFHNFLEEKNNPLKILDKIVDKNEMIQVIIIPMISEYEMIWKLEPLPFDELKKMDLNKLKRVIFEFIPNKIYEFTKKDLMENLFEIFFGIVSEHRFSYCAKFPSDEKFDEMIYSLQDERTKLNKEGLEYLEKYLIKYGINKNNIKFKKKFEKKIDSNYIESVNYLLKTLPKIKEKNKKYSENILYLILGIYFFGNSLRQKKIELFIKELELYGDELQEERVRINLENILKELDEKIKNKIKDIKIKASINDENIMQTLLENREAVEILLNDKEIMDYLLSRAKYIMYLTEGMGLFILLEAIDVENNEIKILNQDIIIECLKKDIFYVFNRNKYIENLGGEFFQNINKNVLKNYLKIFLFSAIEDVSISSKEINDGIKSYLYLKEYISKNEENAIGLDENLFNAKIKIVIHMFEEKILSSSNKIINELNNDEIKKIKQKKYSVIKKEYVDDILNYYKVKRNSGNEFFKIVAKEYNSRKEALKNSIDKFENTKEEGPIKKVIDELNLRGENKNKFFKEAEEHTNNIIDGEIEILKEFAFSNLKRTEVFYQILLLKLLQELDHKKLEENMKNKGYKGESFQQYFRELKTGKKNLGEEHLKYIIEYLSKDKDIKSNERGYRILQCMNFLNLYKNDVMENVLSLIEYERMFRFYKIIKVTKIENN